jgi:lipoyl(octanoyl) transferase
MRLAHLHLSNLTPFGHASLIQQTLVSRLLTHKKLCDCGPKKENWDSISNPPPDPTILTFTPYPVYATGRRDFPNPLPDLNTGSSGNTASFLPLPTSLEPIRHLLLSSQPVAEYYPTLRGG